jgi:hypothetical protein
MIVETTVQVHTGWDPSIIEKNLATDPPTVACDLLDASPESDKALWIVVPVAQ